MIGEIANFRDFRRRLKEYLDKVMEGTTMMIKSKDRNVVMMSMDEYLQLTGDETEYLLASESNRRHLQEGMEQVDRGDTEKISVDDLLD
ncbi:MAG: type II toxin-antitoxin system Phd/YefM family antitoxin [Saprospiraceae bacterium]|nr:type II toxin-antitoxin system Phd/YefM family antitoxin [Saprospiraceae bacterium]